jgi:hypothetical protein
MNAAQQTSAVTSRHRPDAGTAGGLPAGSVEDLVAILASLQDQLDGLAATARRQQQAIDRLNAAILERDR